MPRPGRNDPCHCGSGKKYKKCHMELDEGAFERRLVTRGSSSLREKNLMLLAATKEIFHLERPWDQVKSGMTDARIRAFYEFIADLWPLNTPPSERFPPPASGLRALYLGENMPEVMLDSVFRFSLYADQIILPHPFDNPHRLQEQYNPINHPDQWRLQTLRVVHQLAMLAPWIAADIVVMMPEPGDFDPALFWKTAEMAQARLGDNFMADVDIEELSMTQARMREFYLLPNGHIERKVREMNPEITQNEVDSLLKFVAMTRRDDPLLLNTTWDQLPGQMTNMKMGANLETSLLLCQTIGAFPYTNVKFRWKEILGAANELDENAQVWSPLTHAFQQLDFKFLNKIDSDFAVEMRNEGRLSGFRSFMRKLWNEIDGEPDLAKQQKLALDFKDELGSEYDKAEADWDAIDRDLMKWAMPAIAGAFGSIGAVATGHLGLALPTGGFAVNGINELIQAHMKRKEFRKKTPMSVFIDLDKKKS
jgi:SEC-C motif